MIAFTSIAALKNFPNPPLLFGVPIIKELLGYISFDYKESMKQLIMLANILSRLNLFKK